MKLTSPLKTLGFTLNEMMIALAISAVVLAVTLTSSVSLQKSFSAVDNYFATHMQQIRIVDYLSRDVKRGLSVTTSADLQTVTVATPNYIIQPTDPEAIANPALAGTPRMPTIIPTTRGLQVNYGYGNPLLTGVDPVAIDTYDALHTWTSIIVYSIGADQLSILRTENGRVTTIASSTDQLVPKSTDVELANTEYTQSSITFQPIFTSGGTPAQRSGTTVCSTAYLRNKRRG